MALYGKLYSLVRLSQGNHSRPKTPICLKLSGKLISTLGWFKVTSKSAKNVNHPKFGGKNFRWSKSRSNRWRMTQNDLPWSHSADIQKLPPVATPKVGGKIFRLSKNESNRWKVMQNDLPWSRSADSQKLPPVATPKVGGKNFRWSKNQSNRWKRTSYALSTLSETIISVIISWSEVLIFPVFGSTV